jgi:hypothetical protein
MNTTQQVQFVLGQFLQLTQGVATHSRAMFNINKIAGVANAIVNTSLGVTKALSAYAPPLSFVMAAAQLAAGMAQVQQIQAASFGGTSAPSIGGGAAIPVTPAESVAPPAQPVTPAQPSGPPTVVNITLTGSRRYTADEVDELIREINERVGDGVTLKVNYGI